MSHLFPNSNQLLAKYSSNYNEKERSLPVSSDIEAREILATCFSNPQPLQTPIINLGK
jgi:hypothetical protein